MNTARTRTIAFSAVLAVVLLAATPALAAPTTYLTTIEKSGMSGQRYAWAPGGC